MEFAVLKSGVIKSKNYCPNPVAINGIPNYADTIRNPKCRGTPAYNNWWEEQIGYMINGYSTGGITVPGRYYKFVNFDTIRGVAGDSMRAELHDFQLDYAYFIEQAKEEHFNILVPKARRKTVTTMNVCMNVDYGYRFELGYKAGIIAGQQKFADTFYDEWIYTDSKQYPELRIKQASKGDDVIAGYKWETDLGDKIDSGSMNSLFFRTVFHDPNVMKGKYLNDAILEESGENEHLVECVNATMDCLMRGAIQYGTLHIYGTGGNMNKGSKGFKKMYFDAIKDNAFRCRVLFIPASVFYFPFYSGATEKGVLIEDVPNISHIEPYKRVGWSDEDRAKEHIEAEKKKLLAKGDLKEYFDYCQNNPTTVKEVFRKTATNNFPIIELNDQGYQIESSPKKYGKYKLEYKKDPSTGQVLVPYEVEAIPAKDIDAENECVLILHDGHPVEGFRWLDVGGIDSYDQDQSQTSKSLGAMVVFRGKHNIPNVPEWCPVALIRCRPKRKEIFYEMCLKLSIYYRLYNAALIDVRNFAIGNYFKEMDCERYLSKRPRKFESPDSKQLNEYGMSLNNFSKPRMVSALQTFFCSHTSKVWFGDIIEESLNYDETEDDSDNDTVDALGIALMRMIDQDQVAENEGDLMKKDPFAYPDWGHDQHGNMVDMSYMKKLNKEEPLGKHEDYFSRYSRMIINQDFEETQTSDPMHDI